MELGLEGAVALVVGGSGYLGREIARQFTAEGAHVVIAGRDQQRLSDVAKTLGGAVVTRVLDTGSQDSVSSALESVLKDFGRLDVVVLGAAPSARTLDPERNEDPAQVLAAFNAKAMGYLRVANTVLPVMTAAGGGRIIFVNGQNALVTGNITGSVRNGAVVAISKNLADASVGTGVTVNVVNPGVVSDKPAPTPHRGMPGETSPAQVASVVVFLASRRAAGVSGESIAIGHRVLGSIAG